MAHWEERITQASDPALRFEHVARYRAAAPIVLASEVWCDLGCGTGVASSAALAGFSGRTVLVDTDASALSEAVAISPGERVLEIVCDLSSPDDLAAMERLVEPAEPACFTCFEVLEYVELFPPLVEWLVRMSTERAHTAVLSVRNDEFWSLESPYRRTMWGETAFGELTALLPKDHVVAAQIAVAGSCIGPAGTRVSGETKIPESIIPSHFLVAFGPRAGELGRAVELSAVDVAAQRTWERQRLADLAYYRELATRANT